MSIVRLALIVVLSLVAAGAASLPVSAAPQGAPPAAAPAGALGSVRYIYRGLALQPPRQARRAAHTHDALFDHDGLHTGAGQKASIGFTDGTVLQMNQLTDATLTAHVTTVQHGEAAEYLAPGTKHDIQTNAAVATANGTTFDVSFNGSVSVFVVLHGALLVVNPKGSVLVKTNHETRVTPGQAPLPPSPVDALAVFSWTSGIPAPDLGEDVGLDANGGNIAAFSSQRTDSGDAGNVSHINDGLLTQGWESATGQTANQTVTVGFFGGSTYRISDVIIDPAATYGEPSSEDLRHFSIRVSTTGTDAASFTTIPLQAVGQPVRTCQGTGATSGATASGTVPACLINVCQRKATLQRFHFATPVRARYVQLVAIDNYGSSRHVAVAEWEVVATASLFAQPSAVAVGPRNTLYVTDTTADRVDVVSTAGSKAGRIIAHWGKKGSGPGQFLDPEGIALDAQGNVYVVDRYNHRVEKFSPVGKLLLTFGSPGLGPGQLEFARGIAVDRKGDVWISDTWGTIGTTVAYYVRLQKFSPQGKLLAHWDQVADAGSLPEAGGISFDHAGNLWVANTGASDILEVSAGGTLLKQIGTAGSLPGQFSEPTDVSVDGKGNVYVTDGFNDRVQRITPSGQAVAWGGFGFSRGAFALPGGLTIAPDGKLYVADTHNGRIQVLAGATGKVLSVWGKFATIPTILGDPGGLAVDPHGDVWITDTVNDRVQVRDPQGHVLAVLGYHGVVPTPTQNLGQFFYPQGIAINSQGEVYVADSGNYRLQELAPAGPIGALGSHGTTPGKFSYPWGVAVDGAGNIYVADRVGDRVQKFSPDGKVIWSVGTPGSGPGQFNEPYGIAVDPAGNVYVSNFGGDVPDGRIEKLSPDGKVLDVWGSPDELGQSRFAGPAGLAVDTQGNLYVGDYGHGAVQKLSPSGTVLGVFELPGANAGPIGVAVDKNGDIYAADSLNGNIVKFSPGGEVIAIWS